MKSLPIQIVNFRGAAGLLAVALLSMIAMAVAADPTTSGERHWDLKLADQPSGSFRESSVVGADGNVTTKEQMVMEINRLGSKVSIQNETETVENPAGEMQSLVTTMSSSQASTRLRVTRGSRSASNRD